MPVIVNRTVFIKDKDGKIVQLTATDQVSAEQTISVICDGPRCGSRRLGAEHGKPVEVSWSEEAAKTDPNGLPDSFFRLISLIIDNRAQKQLVFCGSGCAKDFLTYSYVTPLSPREEAEIQMNNQKADASKNKPPTNVLNFPAPTLSAPNIEIVDLGGRVDASPKVDSEPKVVLDGGIPF